MKIKINVFCKEVKSGDGRSFISYSTKNKEGVYHQVRFVMDCENAHLIPKGRKPFVLITDTKKVSKGVKKFEEFDLPIYYIRGIDSVEDYEDEEIPAGEFEELPF